MDLFWVVGVLPIRRVQSEISSLEPELPVLLLSIPQSLRFYAMW